MSQYSESYTPHTEESVSEPSTTDAVRNEATDVAQHARQAGGQVTQTATEQTKQVAAEAGRQARGLLGEAQGQVRDQASTGQQKAAQQLRSVADEIGQMAEKGGTSGVATNAARQAADRLHSAAGWLEQREPADLLDQARSFARRRPGAFLIGAAVAGLAAGRLTRGLVADHQDQKDEQTGSDGSVTPVYPSEPLYPATPVSPAESVYPAESADPFVPVYPAEPVYPVEPVYPGEPVYPAEPGRAPGYGETR
jgi:hypothetical protein